MKEAAKAMDLPIAVLKRHALLVGAVISILAAVIGFAIYRGADPWPDYALCLIGGLVAGYFTLWLMEISVKKIAEGRGKYTAILWMLLRVIIFAAIFLCALKLIGLEAGLGIALGYLSVFLGLFISNIFFPKTKKGRSVINRYVLSEKNKKLAGKKHFIVIKSVNMQFELNGRIYRNYRRFHIYEKAVKPENTPGE